MRFPQTVEYALRAMAQLAIHSAEGRAVRAQDLAEQTGIPIAYLSKILRKLVVGGLLDSQKGHHGGFTLAKSPKEISFEDVLLAVDYHSEPDSCVFGCGRCDMNNPCPLHPAWSKLQEGFDLWAKHTSMQAALARAGKPKRKRKRVARTLG